MATEFWAGGPSTRATQVVFDPETTLLHRMSSLITHAGQVIEQQTSCTVTDPRQPNTTCVVSLSGLVRTCQASLQLSSHHPLLTQHHHQAYLSTSEHASVYCRIDNKANKANKASCAERTRSNFQIAPALVQLRGVSQSMFQVSHCLCPANASRSPQKWCLKCLMVCQ